uniref:Uncharacterized protein n=1 Tax=Romanomermis culicivorax TaxID=13658 RepID=A0A915L7V4_ROMCU
MLQTENISRLFFHPTNGNLTMLGLISVQGDHLCKFVSKTNAVIAAYTIVWSSVDT